MNFIFIEGMRVEARVGVYPREQAPQSLDLDISFGVPENAAKRNVLEGTIDYATVIETIRSELKSRQFQLLENLGEYIIDVLLGRFGAPWVKISIAKVGIMKDVKRVGVRIEKTRGEN